MHFGLLALAPLALIFPTGSSMLVIPLVPATAEASAVWASRAGARLIGPGPTAGSILIDATAGQMLLPSLKHGALLVRSGATGCGVPVED